MSPRSPFKGGDPSPYKGGEPYTNKKIARWLVDDTFSYKWFGRSYSTYMTLLPRDARLMVGRHILIDAVPRSGGIPLPFPGFR